MKYTSTCIYHPRSSSVALVLDNFHDLRDILLIVDDIGICVQSIKHGFGNIPACTVGAVQTDLHALEGIDAQRNQVANIAIAACHIVHSAADVLAVSERQLRPVLIKHMKLAVIVGVVAGRDHDAAIKVIHTGDVGHRRRSGDVQQVGICAGSGQINTSFTTEAINSKIFFLFPKRELLALYVALYALAGKSVACCSPRRGSIFEQHSHADAWPQS